MQATPELLEVAADYAVSCFDHGLTEKQTANELIVRYGLMPDDLRTVIRDATIKFHQPR